MLDHLEKTYFNRVWNATKDHGQANFVLNKAASRPQLGAVPVSLSVVGLPTTGTVYAVYRAPIEVFGRFIHLLPYQWINAGDVLTKQAITLSAYTAVGQMIPNQAIYAYYDPQRSLVLIAIGSIFTKTCTGDSYPNLYMTVYRDTSRQTPVVRQLYQSTAPAVVTAALHDAMLHYTAGTMVYVNGWLYDPTTIPPLSVTDVVEIISDPDIVGYCDLFLDDNQTGYYSQKFGEYREILHIPKALNPNNYVITHDTITIGIFDAVNNKGVYGHRVDPHALEAISHNDFSMGRTTLQAFQQGLGAPSIKVRLYVRYSTNPIDLVDNINHLQDLYVLPDDEIKKQLAGLSLHPITEWNAAYLEQSGYLSLVYDYPSFTGDDVLQSYSDAMGYYDVASTLSQAMHYYTYKGDAVEITKPRRLIGYPCQALVYANGRKIPDYSVVIADCGNSTVKLTFKPDTYIDVNATMAVYLTEGGNRTPISFNPTTAAPTLSLDTDDYTLVKIVSYDTPQAIWQNTTTKGYHSLPVSPGDYHMVVNADNSVTLSVNPVHYGDHFYLVPYGGMSSGVYSLDSYLANKQPIIIPLTTSDQDNNLFPLVGYATLEIYLNGYRLVEGLDYSCDPVMGSSDDVLQTLLVITNEDYLHLESSGNMLEIVVHGDAVVSSDKGYVINNQFHRHEPPMLWSASCGRAYAHGLLVSGVTEVGDVVTSPQPLDQGIPYLLEWSLPFSVKKLMATVLFAPDTDLRTRIFKVLNGTPPSYPPTVVLSHLFALYSPYLAAIITDVATGVLTLVNEVKDDQFLKQFNAYALLLSRDPVLLGNNPLIDRRFVTLAAHFDNFVINRPDQMVLVQRLIALLLNPAPLAIEQVLI
jgi:hypothetical protein